MTELTMFDSVDLDQIPASPQAVACYVNGRFANSAEARDRFPHAHILTIAISADADADVLDIETGDATPAQAAAWFLRQKARGVNRPCLYASASVMDTQVIPTLDAAGIGPREIRLWSAHYTHTPHICGPRSCGAVSADMDGTQWTDRADGRNLDQSLLRPDFFAVPAPPARPATVPSGPREWTTAGQSSLAELAREHGAQPSTVLRLTAEHSPGAVYPPEVANWLNEVFAGAADPRKPMPAGLRLWLPG